MRRLDLGKEVRTEMRIEAVAYRGFAGRTLEILVV
jgi:hypothetical protein